MLRARASSTRVRRQSRCRLGGRTPCTCTVADRVTNMLHCLVAAHAPAVPGLRASHQASPTVHTRAHEATLWPRGLTHGSCAHIATGHSSTISTAAGAAARRPTRVQSSTHWFLYILPSLLRLFQPSSRQLSEPVRLTKCTHHCTVGAVGCFSPSSRSTGTKSSLEVHVVVPVVGFSCGLTAHGRQLGLPWRHKPPAVLAPAPRQRRTNSMELERQLGYVDGKGSWLHNAPGVVASRCCARGVPACDTAIHDAQLCIHSAWLHQPRPGPHRQRMCHRVVAQVCRAIGSLTCLSTRPFELEIGCPYRECQQTFGAWYLAVAVVAVPQPGFRC